MTKLLPILLGSRAAKTNHHSSDYDIIAVSEMQFSDSDAKIDLFNRPYDIELLDYLNNLHSQLDIVDILGHQMIVPPNDILAMIYLTSIVRIIPYSTDHDVNVQIWLKRVSTYNKLRSQIDYQKFDNDIYHNNDGILYKQFHARFDHKIQQYGDSIITLEEDSDAFFKDNVKRKFDHDYLHTLVAQMNRGTDALFLFEKFQNKNNVGLNEELFENGATTEKVHMIQEEMIVLMLERKIIPALELNDEYNLDYFNTDFNSIASHFATNLCGQKHHFLRKWVLDHFKLITDTMSITMDTIVNKAYELCQITSNKNINPLTYKQMSEESVKIYEQLNTQLFKNDVISADGCLLYLSGPKRGIGVDLDGIEFFLEISLIDSVCIFRQIYTCLDDKNPKTKVVLYDKEIDKTKTIRISKVWRQATYCSVTECNNTCDVDGCCDNVQENDTSETEIVTYRYYLNSYGHIKRFTLCDMVARQLIRSTLAPTDVRLQLI